MPKPCKFCKGTGFEPDAETLRKKREEAGLPLRRVADAMGISAAYLSNLENGRRAWRPGLEVDFEKAVKALKKRK